MNTLKKIDEKFSKYIGFALSLLLIWLIKKDSIILATHIFSMSSLVSLFIIGELIGKRKNTINKPLLICVLIPNLVITITAVILIVTLPISFGVLYSQKKKAK